MPVGSVEWQSKDHRLPIPEAPIGAPRQEQPRPQRRFRFDPLPLVVMSANSTMWLKAMVRHCVTGV